MANYRNANPLIYMHPDAAWGPRWNCYYCAYSTATGALTTSGKGQNLASIDAHNVTIKHLNKARADAGRLAIITAAGYPPFEQLPYVPRMVGQCLVCSLDKLGAPKMRALNMSPAHCDEHLGSVKHAARVVDGRLAIYRARHANHPGPFDDEIW